MSPLSPDPSAEIPPPALPGAAAFGLEVRPLAAGVLIAHVRGDLDYLVTPVLRRRLLEHLGAAVSLLVVDLTTVTLLSAAAIQTLLTVHQMAPEHGVEVRLVAASRAVLRPLQLTGVDVELPLHATLAEATRRG